MIAAAWPASPLYKVPMFEVWDERECVSRHMSTSAAHKACLNSRHVSPDSGRRLTLFDLEGRIVSIYIDGVEQIDGVDGSAFPNAAA